MPLHQIHHTTTYSNHFIAGKQETKTPRNWLFITNIITHAVLDYQIWIYITGNIPFFGSHMYEIVVQQINEIQPT